MRFDVMPVKTEKQIVEIEKAANTVWQNFYRDILPQDHVDLVVKKYHSGEALREQLDNGYFCQMIICDGEFAGYFCYKLNSDHTLISRLYVKPEYRRRGLAKRTVEHLESIIKNEENGLSHIRKIRMYVNRSNNFAVNVYERLGFNKTRVVDRDLIDGYVCKEYVMERRIK